MFINNMPNNDAFKWIKCAWIQNKRDKIAYIHELRKIMWTDIYQFVMTFTLTRYSWLHLFYATANLEK